MFRVFLTLVFALLSVQKTFAQSSCYGTASSVSIPGEGASNITTTAQGGCSDGASFYFQIGTKPSWVSAYNSGNTIYVSAGANNTGSSRSGSIQMTRNGVQIGVFSVSQAVGAPGVPPAPSVVQNCGYTRITRTNPPSGSGITYHWQTTSSGTNTTNNSSSYVDRTSGTVYYLRAKNSNGWSDARTITYSVKTVPGQPIDPSVDVPGCEQVTLKRILYDQNSGNGNIWYWQDTADGVSISNTNETITLSRNQVGDSFTYYLRSKNTGSGCWSTAASVSYSFENVNQPPAPSVDPNCGNTVLTRADNPTGFAYYWQDTPTGELTLNANGQQIKTFTGNGTIYLRSRSSAGCWSSARTITYTVDQGPSTPPVPSVNDDNCGSTILTRANPPSGSGVTYYWQASATGDDTGPENAASTKTLTSGTTYYLRSRNNSTFCWSDARTITYSVKTVPGQPIDPSVDVPGCEQVTLKRILYDQNSGNGNIWYWQDTADGVSTSNTNETITLSRNQVGDSFTYYLRSKNTGSGCWSTAASVSYTFPSQTVWYLDADNDDYAISTLEQCTNPGPGYTSVIKPLGDCDDEDETLNPDTIWYTDTDGDNFKDANGATEIGCSEPAGNWTRNPESVDDNCPNEPYSVDGSFGCPPPCTFELSSTDFEENINVIGFDQNGGIASVTVGNYSAECTTPRNITISYLSNPAPEWLQVTPSGNTLSINCDPTTEARTVTVLVTVNGSLDTQQFTVGQGGPTSPPDPPSTTCQANPVPNVSLAALGETKQVDITFVDPNNCNGPFYLEHPYDQNGVPSWLSISPGTFSNGVLSFTLSVSENETGSSQDTVLALAKDDGTGTGNTVLTGGINFTVTQYSCLTAWYPDTDGDGFGDVFGNCFIGCNPPSDPYLNWVDNNIDLCPEREGTLENKGCPVGEIPENQNAIVSKSFDINETLKSAAKGYYDEFGKAIQTQSWSLKTNDTWATQTMYDEAGRSALYTLAAPIREGLTFDFKSDFVRKENNTSNYDLTDFGGDRSEIPNEVGNVENTLGWYYSDNNTREQYQDATKYPFSKNVYSKLNPGATLRNVGGNKIDTDQNGEVDDSDSWAQTYTFSMRASNELSTFSTLTQTPYDEFEIVKTVARDVHGVENIVFNDISGKVLGTSRSGQDGTISSEMDLAIDEAGYVDIHVPAGITGFTLSDPNKISIYNLITEELVNTSSQSLTNGFYRVVIDDLDTYEPNSVVVSYKVNYYDFSLNRYDGADRIIASYQPLNQLKTTYTYNTLNQLVESKSPEGGISRFIYREDGLIRFSQNSKQAELNEVSYTNYDDLARPTESGVMIGVNFENLDATSSVGSTLKEQLFTKYDAIPEDDTTLQGLSQTYNTPTFLNGKVARTKNEQSTTYYSYDVYGRVKWVVQNIVDIGLKTVDYTYEPITGLTTEVDFQRELTNERFVHKYEYNDADELIKVFTSVDGQTFNLQVEYSYYETGAIKRMELANGAQGVDYVYNLNGRVKGINHPDLDYSKDPGGDSNDLFGMQVDYYNNDYNRQTSGIQPTKYGIDQFNGNIKGIRWNNKRFENNPTSVYSYQYNRNNWLTEAKFGTYGENLDPTLENNKVDNSFYDNNSGSIKIEGKTSVTLQDGFHAKSGSDVHIRIVPSQGFVEDEDGDYNVTGITYDPNGNIKTLNRNTNTENGENTMDQLTYNYYQDIESGLEKGTPNQLRRVEDGVTRETNPKDIKGQSGNNYKYNTIGQLISNEEEGISYTYNVSGLVTQISKNNVPLVRFFYNDRNHRVKKESYIDGIIQQQTHYVRDVSGQVLAVYNTLSNGTPTVEEHPIYGANRIGIFKRPGLAVYQLTDHLGNVRATFGANLSGAPVGENFNDYYPFGMLMSGRNSISDYRYAFQGQEKDTETNKEAFELRLWDSRIGRWLTTDPKRQYNSPYLGMGNNPISRIDPDGGDDWVLDEDGKVRWDKDVTSSTDSDLNGRKWLGAGKYDGWNYANENSRTWSDKLLGRGPSNVEWGEYYEYVLPNYMLQLLEMQRKRNIIPLTDEQKAYNQRNRQSTESGGRYEEGFERFGRLDIRNAPVEAYRNSRFTYDYEFEVPVGEGKTVTVIGSYVDVARSNMFINTFDYGSNVDIYPQYDRFSTKSLIFGTVREGYKRRDVFVINAKTIEDYHLLKDYIGHRTD